MSDSQLKKIENKKSITHCYISKGSYYRPNHSGYTDYLSRAGVYEKADAIDSAKKCRELTLIPITTHEHNAMILLEVRDLLTRIITK